MDLHHHPQKRKLIWTLFSSLTAQTPLMPPKSEKNGDRLEKIPDLKAWIKIKLDRDTLELINKNKFRSVF